MAAGSIRDPFRFIDQMTSSRDMPYGSRRPLTGGERAALSAGLVAALDRAGAAPLIVARASVLARASALWRGKAPVITLHQRIYWPGALEDFSAAGNPGLLSTLQHELQHVLEFATGDLSLLGYAFGPRNWRYAYRVFPGCRWRDFGAEQRACIAEDHWRAENGLLARLELHSELRRLLPWLRNPDASSPP
ncbi:MAG: hypothetical protein ACXWVH_05385 [Caulobacteraceae bacterium]